MQSLAKTGIPLAELDLANADEKKPSKRRDRLVAVQKGRVQRERRASRLNGPAPK
jgi:hypothetical protein